jgi:hypothetical protein
MALIKTHVTLFTLLIVLFYLIGVIDANDTRLEKGQFLVGIDHQFRGDVTQAPLDTFLGTDQGATVGLYVRGKLWHPIETEILYINYEKEYRLGLNYKKRLPYSFESQLAVHYFTFKETGSIKRQHNFFYFLSLNRFTDFKVSPTINLAYDGYTQRMGAGLGFDYRLSEALSVVFEYYPENGTTSTAKDVFNFGIKYRTFGHIFLVNIQNSSDLGVRRLMQGTVVDYYQLGFTVQRVLEL